MNLITINTIIKTNFELLTAEEMNPLRGGKYDQKTNSSQGITKSNGAYDSDQDGDADPDPGGDDTGDSGDNDDED